jgi:hypothetical protein
MQNLLGQSGGAPESVLERHPDGSWRADALGGSRHARLSDHIREPLDDLDEARAEAICAEACRNLLVDFTPALTLLPLAERQRAQALATYAQTLFDFAGQPGVEGERLAAMNRVEFTLEEALQGEVVGQPTFLRMAASEAERPWDRGALDEIVQLARGRVFQARPETVAEAVADSEALALAVARALLPTEPGEGVVRLGGALIRLHSLTTLGEDLRRGRARLPADELPSLDEPGRRVGRDVLNRVILAEVARVRSSLQEAGEAARSVPAPWRRGVVFLRLAGLELAARVEATGWQITSRPPRLGAGARIGLLLRARFRRR